MRPYKKIINQKFLIVIFQYFIIITRTKTSIRYAKENDREKREMIEIRREKES